MSANYDEHILDDAIFAKQYTSLTTSEFWVYSTWGTFSAVFWFILTVCYIFVDALRKTPGMLVFWQILSELIINIHWIYAAYQYNVQGEVVVDTFCTIFGAVVFYSWFIGWNYLMYLSIEILVRIRNPLDVSYEKRALMYHTMGQGSAIALAIAAFACGNTGEAISHTCYITPDNWWSLAMVSVIFIHTPVALFWVIYSLVKMDQQNSYMKKYSLFVMLYIILYVPAAVDHFISSWVKATPIFGIVAFVMASLAGFVTAAFRLSDPSIVRRIKRVVRKVFCPNKVKKDWWQLSTEYGVPILQRENSLVSVNNREFQFFHSIFSQELYIWLTAMYFIFDNQAQGKAPGKRSSGRLSTAFDEFRHKQEWKISSADIQAIPNIKETVKSRLEGTKIRVYEYAPYVFHCIRKRDKIDILELIAAIEPEANNDCIKSTTENVSGRGGKFIYFTYDYKFVIKGISMIEKDLLVDKLLKLYSFHLQETDNQSLLCRIYGIFTINIGEKTYHVSVMQNLITNYKSLITWFDIKGSWAARKVTSCDTITQMSDDKTYKDQDFAASLGSIQLQNANQLKAMINKDVQLLMDSKIMDYSLFVVVLAWPSKKKKRGEFRDLVNNRAYSIGIIDYLQTYDIHKKLEHVYKSFRTNKADISAVDEETYAQRFLDRIEEIIT